MKKPLEKCCNGCDAPPKPPSWVLCAECFAKLNAKMHDLMDRFGIEREGGSDA